MVVIGLPIASAIALVATLRYFGGRRWAVMVSLGIVVPAVLWFFFVHVVHVPMPPALLEIGRVHDAGLAGGAPA
jgi:nitrate/nitrite transporter NarK